MTAVTPEAGEPLRGGPRLVTDNRGLVAANVGKSFRKRPVLRDVNVGVQRGEAVGLLGPNGAGKTTCFYIITGLIAPDVGTISLDGQDITDLPMYRRARLGIGYLPQEASIFRGLTVEQNIRAVLEVAEPEDEVREGIIDELLAEFSITHLRRAPALALSGGERRRVSRRPPQGSRHRRADHRPQCARDPRYRRSRLHPSRGPRAHGGHAAGDRLRRRCAPRLSRREVQPLTRPARRRVNRK